MSVDKFCRLLHGTKLGKNDKKWFPKWLRQYAATVPSVDGNLPVTEAEVIRFSRSLLASNPPAWQRLQAVRAVEAYRNLVLRSQRPSLERIRRKLSRLAARGPSGQESRRLDLHQHEPLYKSGAFLSRATLAAKGIRRELNPYLLLHRQACVPRTPC